MGLVIRKKGNKNFWHYWDSYEYSASDLVAIFDGNYMKIRSNTGRVVFKQGGYVVSDITIYDDTVVGGAESYLSIVQLEQRLINLGYPAFYLDSEGALDWGNIGGVITNQSDLIDYINNIVAPSMTSQLINDGEDGTNPFLSTISDIDGGSL